MTDNNGSWWKVPDAVKKIVVLRANGLGDFLFAVPALEALRVTYPSAQITLLGLPWHEQFLRDRPSPVDRVLTVPVSEGIREGVGLTEDKTEKEAFFASLRGESFDIALQMHGGGRFSNPFVLAIKARLAVGLRSLEAAPLDLWVPYVYFQPEVLRYLEVASLIGARPVMLEPRIAVTGKDIGESLDALEEDKRPLVAVVPGGGDGRRRWPPDKFAALGDQMVMAGARVLLLGSESEQTIAETISSTMRYRSTNLCGNLTLSALTGLLSRCALVIGNDSGPLHLAKAVGTNSVGIYWCGNLITAEPITRRFHRPVLSWRLECPTCGANCIYSKCDHHDSFVADVTVQEVYGQAMSLYGNGSRGAKTDDQGRRINGTGAL